MLKRPNRTRRLRKLTPAELAQRAANAAAMRCVYEAAVRARLRQAAP